MALVELAENLATSIWGRELIRISFQLGESYQYIAKRQVVIEQKKNVMEVLIVPHEVIVRGLRMSDSIRDELRAAIRRICSEERLSPIANMRLVDDGDGRAHAYVCLNNLAHNRDLIRELDQAVVGGRKGTAGPTMEVYVERERPRPSVGGEGCG